MDSETCYDCGAPSDDEVCVTCLALADDAETLERVCRTRHSFNCACGDNAVAAYEARKAMRVRVAA